MYIYNIYIYISTVVSDIVLVSEHVFGDFLRDMEQAELGLCSNMKIDLES